MRMRYPQTVPVHTSTISAPPAGDGEQKLEAFPPTHMPAVVEEVLELSTYCK